MTGEAQYRIVIADDHPLFRGALATALGKVSTGLTVLEAGSFAEVTALLAKDHDVDLVFLDLTMPGVKAFSGLIQLRAQFPGVPVVVVSANDDASVVRRCMEFGASGFIPKTLPVDEMRDAARLVLEGSVYVPPGVDLMVDSDAETREIAQRLSNLTPQQMRVLMMLSEGLLNKQIAYELNVSEATVKAHVSAILLKLDVDSRTQAVILANKIEQLHTPGQSLNG
jgi:DNA-binding NarL/FixJ family response regulator